VYNAQKAEFDLLPASRLLAGHFAARRSLRRVRWHRRSYWRRSGPGIAATLIACVFTPPLKE
jgi:hypothetical protein